MRKRLAIFLSLLIGFTFGCMPPALCDTKPTPLADALPNDVVKSLNQFSSAEQDGILQAVAQAVNGSSVGEVRKRSNFDAFLNNPVKQLTQKGWYAELMQKYVQSAFLMAVGGAVAGATTAAAPAAPSASTSVSSTPSVESNSPSTVDSAAPLAPNAPPAESKTPSTESSAPPSATVSVAERTPLVTDPPAPNKTPPETSEVPKHGPLVTDPPPPTKPSVTKSEQQADPVAKKLKDFTTTEQERIILGVKATDPANLTQNSKLDDAKLQSLWSKFLAAEKQVHTEAEWITLLSKR